MTKRLWSPRSLKLPEVTFLAEQIEMLPEHKREFARSLVAQAMRRGTLSDKQLRTVAGLVTSLRRTRREAHTE